MIDHRYKHDSDNGAVIGRADAAARGAVLGRRLREMYREVAQEPIPPEFIRLLRKLDASEEN